MKTQVGSGPNPTDTGLCSRETAFRKHDRCGTANSSEGGQEPSANSTEILPSTSTQRNHAHIMWVPLRFKTDIPWGKNDKGILGIFAQD